MTTRPYKVIDTKTGHEWIVVCESVLKAKRHIAENVMMELEASALSALEVILMMRNGTPVIHVQEGDLLVPDKREAE